jgi:hypothetical protein
MKPLMLLCSLISVIPAAELSGKVVGVKSGNAIEVDITGTESDGTLIGAITLPNGTNLGAELIKGGLRKYWPSARWRTRTGPSC